MGNAARSDNYKMSESDNDLSLSGSALDRIQLMSNNFQNSLEGDQTLKAIKGETPKVSNYFQTLLSPDDIHLAFDQIKRESPKQKRWDPIQPGNHGWLASETAPNSAPTYARDQKYDHHELPWERSIATDRLFYEAITSQIFDVILEDVIVNDLYDIAGLAIQEEYAFLKKKFSRMQELIELKKQKKVLHALKLEILALADDLEFKIIESTEEESKVTEAVEKALKQLKDEYMEVDVKDNKLEISKQSLKSQELTEKLQKLQKLHKEEVDRKKSDQLADQSVSEKPSKESEKDKKGKKSENSRENSSKKSKKDSKSKKKSKEISDIKNEKQKKKDKKKETKIKERSKKGPDKSLPENSPKKSS